MSIRKSVILFGVALSMAAFISGCSSSTKEGGSAADVPKVSEATCAQCHGSAYNSQSGMPIYTEYVASKHFLPSNHFLGSIGASVGCQDCHGGGAMHNGVGPLPYPNPDTAGKCWECHQNEFLGQYNIDKTASTIQKAHFYNITGAGVHPAMFATTNFQKGCTACHEAHNPLNGRGKAERQAWVTSGHGNINSVAFATEDFKGITSCIRCHTSTGYSNFMAGTTGGTTGAWSDPFPAATWATPGDNGREVFTCRTCHVNDSFSVKAAPAFIAPYNNNLSKVNFPDNGQSNICIACHSGRESAATIEAIANFTNASFKNSHYKAGAGLMYMAVGFDNFTSAATVIGTTTYLKTMTPDNITVPTYGISGGVSSTHRKLGTSLIHNYSNKPAFIPGQYDANGPCVTCHLNAFNAANTTGDRPAHGHTWKIDANAFNQLCTNCHTSEQGVPLTALNFETAFLEEQKKGFTDALLIIQNLLLTNYKISYDPALYPYFYDENLPLVAGKKQQVKDWTRGTGNQKYGKRVMGSAYNLNLLFRDEGAYAHARTYVRRLVYDTIDFLDNNTLDLSTGATALTLSATAGNPVFGIYTKDASAYTGGAPYAGGTLTPGTTAAMAYIIGWTNTGAWSSPERP